MGQVRIAAGAPDLNLRAMWSGITTALGAGNKAAAMQYLRDPAQLKYGPVFDALLPDMTQILASWSSPLTSSLSASIGEYAVITTSAGARQLFLIYFVKEADGVWRLDSM